MNGADEDKGSSKSVAFELKRSDAIGDKGGGNKIEGQISSSPKFIEGNTPEKPEVVT